MKYNTATPYIASYALIRQDGKLAFVLRSNTGWMDGYYGLPAGKVEKGESFTEGVIREAKEEVGIAVLEHDLKPVLTCHRYGSADQNWVDVIFEVQKWEGEVVNAEPHMHSEVAWLDPEDLPANVIPANKFFLEQIQAGSIYCEFGWNVEKTD